MTFRPPFSFLFARFRPNWLPALMLLLGCLPVAAQAQVEAENGLHAGVARIEITDRAAGPVRDPLYAKALVLRHGSTSVVLVTIDAVSIGEIGRIGNGYLAAVRAELERDLGLPPHCLLVNASHCHGVVRGDVAALTVQVVKEAWKSAVPARAGSGAGEEARISENRRILMKDGSEVDMRRAYALPPGDKVAALGPIDPQIGLLRIDREDGSPLAVVYNFACHPIMNPPSAGNTADYPGAASRVIEEELGGGALAFFIQGCAGDINPIGYKAVSHPPKAEPLGAMLGLSVMRVARHLQTSHDAGLKLESTKLEIPRAADFEKRIAALEAKRLRLAASIQGTNLDFKSFLPLLIQHRLSPEGPSGHVQQYLREQAGGAEDLLKFDKDNQAALEACLRNIEVMEALGRLNANLALLKKHHAQTLAAGSKGLEVEVCGLRVGDFRLITFPGELTVQVGLNIKKAAPHGHSFVAGYTNGYIYYAPTAAQRKNTGHAQEDCDTLVAPEWQALFEARALELLKKL